MSLPMVRGGSFSDKLSAVVVHDSCTYGLLFCSIRFLLFSEISLIYSATRRHKNMIKCLNPLTTMRFSSEIIRFHISEVVVISVWMNA